MKRVSSFISNFKQYGKRFAVFVLTIIFCIIIGKLFDYLLVDDTYNGGSSEVRALFHDFYKQDNIDYLYLGCSHVFSDIMPDKLDEMNGMDNFELSTPGQPYNASYYLLKEADRKYDISHVYMEMYYGIPVYQDDRDGLDTLTHNWDILNQMPVSINKFSYMCNMSSREYYPMTFLASRRFAGHIFDQDVIRGILETKRSEKYLNYEFGYGGNDKYVSYQGKGFICGNMEYAGDTFAISSKGAADFFAKNPLGENSKEYLGKIITYCQERDIEITLFSSPVAEIQLYTKGDYDFYVQQIRDIAQEYGIHYYDFNLCSQEYLDLQNPKYFIDLEHLNIYGAERFTSVFGEVMLAEKEGKTLPADMFYDTYQEKVESLNNKIQGLQYYVASKPEELENAEKEIPGFQSEKERLYVLKAVSAEEIEVEYKVNKVVAGQNESIIVQDWSENNKFAISKNESGVLYIEIRDVNDNGVKKIPEISYSSIE